TVAEARRGDFARHTGSFEAVIAVRAVGGEFDALARGDEGDDALAGMAESPAVGGCPRRMWIAAGARRGQRIGLFGEQGGDRGRGQRVVVQGAGIADELVEMPIEVSGVDGALDDGRMAHE